jgi:dihydropyrimidinase
MELLFSEGVNKGKITLNKYVEVASTNAAKIFGMFPKKGTIAVGSDADIVLFDANEKHTLSAKTHHMNVDYSGYEGWELNGKVKTVLLRGKVALIITNVSIEKGYGQFVKRNKVGGII